jgi:hypothetical protein
MTGGYAFVSMAFTASGACNGARGPIFKPNFALKTATCHSANGILARPA